MPKSVSRFKDRAEAGRRIAQRLSAYRDMPAAIVLARPRGGVPVGLEVAQALRVPLDVLLVRKLAVPGRTDLVMGAVASGGTQVLDDEVVTSLRIPPEIIEASARRARESLAHREAYYRGVRPTLDVDGRIVIVVDDGLSDGSTMRAAVATLRTRNAARIVVAVPAAAEEACAEVRCMADEVVCCSTAHTFIAVSQFYEDFEPVSGKEVRAMLQAAAERPRVIQTG